MTTIYVDLVQALPITQTEFVDAYHGHSIHEAQAAYSRYVNRFQPWSWIAKSGDNNQVLAVSSERYFNRSDCLHAIDLLFGSDSHAYRREGEHGNALLRHAVGKASEVLNIADDGTASIRPEPRFE